MLIFLLRNIEYKLSYYNQSSVLFSSICLVQHKSALTMRLLYNPGHPNNRAIMHQKFGISLPNVHKRSRTAVSNLAKNADKCYFRITFFYALYVFHRIALYREV